MRKLLYLIIVALLFTACKKDKIVPTQTPQTLKDKMNGKWNITSVTTIIRDSTKGTIYQHTYPEPAGDYFKFNTDGTWLENLDPSDSNDLAVSGVYTADSDSTFTLSNPANDSHSLCKVSAISLSQFIFTHQRNTVIDGTDPGTIAYIFLLSK